MSCALFLIGMPGAGKTEWGRRVAAAYGLPFFDLDREIETRTCETIETIFASRGEATFREVEATVLKDILSHSEKPYVLSCGGGTPLNQSNWRLLQAHGAIIYLRASIHTLMLNLTGDGKHRPLLNMGADMEMQLSLLYQQRKGIYEGADHIFEVENVSLSDFEPIVFKCINQL